MRLADLMQIIIRQRPVVTMDLHQELPRVSAAEERQ